MAQKNQLKQALDDLAGLGGVDLGRRAERGELPCAYCRDREVQDGLQGDIDDFLLAYLSRQAQE